jgi:hypothetical protein
MKPHWPQVLHVFDVLAYIVKHEDPDKMEIYFTNSKNHARGKNRHDFYNMLDNINTTGKCNMKLSLDRIVESWLAEYEKSKKDSKRRAIASMFHSHKPKNGVNIYVLTDGIWQTKPHSLGGVDEMIKKVVKRLNDKAMAADYIGIQFIRFGNDKYGIERLEKLDRDLGRRGVNEDIVDTEPCDGNVLKMLLGSFNSYWDDDDNSLRSTPLTGSPSTVRSS